MAKDLTKVKAGDFVRSSLGAYGLVIDTPKGLMIIYEDMHGSITQDKEYRRLNEHFNHYYMPYHWKESFHMATPIFPTIEIDIRINGEKAKLSDISEETLIKLRNENK